MKQFSNLQSISLTKPIAVVGLLAAAGFLSATGVANASIVYTFTETRTDVIATVSGSIDSATGLRFGGDQNTLVGADGVFNRPEINFNGIQHLSSGRSDRYFTLPSPDQLVTTAIGSTTSFPRGLVARGTPTGDIFGVTAFGRIYVPNLYVLGTPLSGSLTFTGESIASLGINEDFSLSWDSGNESLTFVVNAVPVPGAVWLLGSGLMGLVGFSRRKC